MLLEAYNRSGQAPDPVRLNPDHSMPVKVGPLYSKQAQISYDSGGTSILSPQYRGYALIQSSVGNNFFFLWKSWRIIHSSTNNVLCAPFCTYNQFNHDLIKILKISSLINNFEISSNNFAYDFLLIVKDPSTLVRTLFRKHIYNSQCEFVCFLKQYENLYHQQN